MLARVVCGNVLVWSHTRRANFDDMAEVDDLSVSDASQRLQRGFRPQQITSTKLIAFASASVVVITVGHICVRLYRAEA